MRKFMDMAAAAWAKGWHESNGGNLSYRIPADQLALVAPYLQTEGPWAPLPCPAPDLAGEYLLLTGQGKYMRFISREAESSLGLITINQPGNAYKLLWGLSQGGRLTSEFSSHLLLHGLKKKLSLGLNRIIYHAHPANLIALSFVLPPQSAEFSRILWSMMPECLLTFPQGLGVLPWLMPGSEELASRSAALMERHSAVLWSQHGLICAGNSFEEAFALTETMEKAAEIYVKILSMGGAQAFPPLRNLRALARKFQLEVNADFFNHQQLNGKGKDYGKL
jgi:rhamnulose-1-phosphate aldolase